MMRRAAAAVAESASTEGLTRPLVIAVTVLTSANDATLGEVGFSYQPAELVRRFSLLAEASGMDGVVASPREVAIVRSAVKKRKFIVITPAVRPAGSVPDDQKRVTTPREAMMAGADYLVVGRPILEATDPVRAAQEIIEEMEITTAKGVS